MPDNTQNEIIILKRLLSEAVGAAYNEERLFLDLHGKNRKGIEQTFVFRVGIHLHELLKDSAYADLDFDCEYNKCGDVLKRTDRSPKGIRPDLLIHSRGNHSHNKLAAEFKGWWNTKDKSFTADIQKLEDLTSLTGEYGYLLGVMVVLNKDAPQYRYFQEGRETP